MKILLHICCAPCAIYPVESLTGKGHYVHGFFYNPNIMPYQPFRARDKWFIVAVGTDGQRSPLREARCHRIA